VVLKKFFTVSKLPSLYLNHSDIYSNKIFKRKIIIPYWTTINLNNSKNVFLVLIFQGIIENYKMTFQLKKYWIKKSKIFLNPMNLQQIIIKTLILIMKKFY
jgi:hypothetical protein